MMDRREKEESCGPAEDRGIPALTIHERFCCNGGSLLPEPSAGRLAARSLDALFKYASGPRGSACPSRNATAQFRDDPS